MDAEAVQLMRVAEELLKFLYLSGSRQARVSYDFRPGRLECLAEAPDLVLSEGALESLRRTLSGPRQPEISEYYGALVGKRMDASELSLVATMAEIREISSEPGRGTRILAAR